MRVLYGVVGEGMGHAVRSRVILDYLADRGHEILIVVSGRAHDFLSRRYAGRAHFRVEKIHGLRLAYEGNALDLPDSIAENLHDLPQNLVVNAGVYRRVLGMDFDPQVVFSDFDQWAYFFGRRHRVPVISVDNMKIIDRCRHDRELSEDAEFEYRLAKVAVQMKVAFAYHYLVSSFFFPPIRKPRTTLVPPILRPEVLALNREPGSHVLVYQTAASNAALVPLLRTLPGEFRVYGMGREAQEDNVLLRAFSEETFLEDLRTARAVISGGSYTLMSEAVHLGVPMLSVPFDDHFEQELNARYLAKLGYGECARRLDAERVLRFLDRVPQYEDALRAFPRQDNSFLFLCIEELLSLAARGVPPPVSLSRAPIFHHRSSS